MHEFFAHTRSEWRNWLADNHPISKGVWLHFYKKISGKPQLNSDIAVVEALCFVCIDSNPKSVDAKTPETRKKRIIETATLTNDNIRAYQ